MLTKEKKDEIRAFLKESPHISLQNVALLYDVTYAQVYVLNREVHGVKAKRLSTMRLGIRLWLSPL